MRRHDLRQALGGGPRAVGRRVLGRTVYRRLDWFELELAHAPRRIEADIPLVVSFLGPADVDTILATRDDLTRAVVQARFDRGDRCYGAWSGSTLACHGWLSTGVARIDYLQLALRLSPTTVYSYDRWTLPALRGLHVASTTSALLYRGRIAEGITRATAAIHPDNPSALTSSRRAGFSRVGTVGWVGLPGLRRPFFRCSRAAPSQRRAAATYA